MGMGALVSEEPLYCALCGSVDWECGHHYDTPGYYEGPWCEVCRIKDGHSKGCPADPGRTAPVTVLVTVDLEIDVTTELLAEDESGDH